MIALQGYILAAGQMLRAIAHFIYPVPKSAFAKPLTHSSLLLSLLLMHSEDSCHLFMLLPCVKNLAL